MSEIEEAIAKTQITDVIYRNGLAHDTEDVEAYVNAYAEDGEFAATVFAPAEIGRAALRAKAKSDVEWVGKLGRTTEGTHKFAMTRALAVNPVIDLIDFGTKEVPK